MVSRPGTSKTTQRDGELPANAFERRPPSRRSRRVGRAGAAAATFGEQGENYMDTEIQSDAGTESAWQRELCDKCGSGMDLQGSAYGFQRWRCPNCQQVVGIDRDPEVGSRFQIARGQPWNYSPDAFKN